MDTPEHTRIVQLFSAAISNTADVAKSIVNKTTGAVEIPDPTPEEIRRADDLSSSMTINVLAGTTYIVNSIVHEVTEIRDLDGIFFLATFEMLVGIALMREQIREETVKIIHAFSKIH